MLWETVMTALGRWLHPVRAWLWLSHNDEIKMEAAFLLPSPYQLDDLVAQYRTGTKPLQADVAITHTHDAAQLPSAVMQALDHNRRHEGRLGAAEGIVLF